MITKLEICDYRSCLDCSLDVQPSLSVLIGPNGGGKTNILCAFLLLKKLVEEGGPHYYPEEEKPTARSKLKATFEINQKRAKLTTLVETYTDENNSDVLVDSSQQWYMKEFTGSAKRVKIPLAIARAVTSEGRLTRAARFYRRGHGHFFFEYRPMDVPESAQKAITLIADFLLGMRYYSASQFTNPGNCPVSFEIEKEGTSSRGLRLRGHAKFLFDLYSEFKAQSPRYGQFFEIIGAKGIGLVDGIDFKEIITSSVDYSVRSGGRVKERKRDKMLVIPQFTIGKHELSPNQLSEGSLKTITLLFYLVTETSSLLLLEEPEVCVHHGLLSSIIELIKTYSEEKQIIISTHSDFVLDHVQPDNVYTVLRTAKQGTKVTHVPKSMSKRELAALRRYLETEGNLGEYWRHGALES